MFLGADADPHGPDVAALAGPTFARAHTIQKPSESHNPAQNHRRLRCRPVCVPPPTPRNKTARAPRGHGARAEQGHARSTRPSAWLQAVEPPPGCHQRTSQGLVGGVALRKNTVARAGGPIVSRWLPIDEVRMGRARIDVENRRIGRSRRRKTTGKVNSGATLAVSKETSGRLVDVHARAVLSRRGSALSST